MSVVAVLAPDLLRDNTLQPPSLTPNTLAALTNLLEVLEEARELVTEEIFPIPGQVVFRMSNFRIGQLKLEVYFLSVSVYLFALFFSCFHIIKV